MTHSYSNERSDAVLAFLEAVKEVCRQHNLSLGHEDCHGGFIVEPFSQYNLDWIGDAASEVPDGDPIV